jgi:hypothetical protein
MEVRAEKFDHRIERHLDALKRLPFSYFSLPMYLDEHAYLVEHNCEDLIVVPNDDSPHVLQLLFVPHQQSNLAHTAIRFVTEAERRAFPCKTEILFEKQTVTEFIFRTSDFVHPIGDLAKKIRSFVSKHKYTVKHSYPRQEIERFYKAWKLQRDWDLSWLEESERSFFFQLDRLDELNIKQVYVEVDGTLAGFAWGVSHPSGNWVGLHMKVLYQYRDLSRFLHRERAKMFEGSEFFSLGTASAEEGMGRFKHELGPIEERKYFFLLLGDKKRLSRCDKINIHEKDGGS